MPRTNNFLQEQSSLGVFDHHSQGATMPVGSMRQQPMGFQIPSTDEKGKKATKRRAKVEDFVLLLADDAEKNPDKMIPLTVDRMNRATALLEGVELD
jgi:hypothetical protein